MLWWLGDLIGKMWYLGVWIEGGRFVANVVFEESIDEVVRAQLLFSIFGSHNYYQSNIGFISVKSGNIKEGQIRQGRSDEGSSSLMVRDKVDVRLKISF